MSDEHFEKRIGTVLRGKWTLERLLGVGGMAAVYVGAHRIGRRDAIKIMHPEVARSKELRARFEQEAHAVNRLGHPGAVQIRDIDSDDDGSMFLVMELLEGEPLSDRAHRMGGLPVDETVAHAERILDVLAAAHEHGIIHRDVKLDNVFITKDGGLKLLDFGIAQVRTDATNSMHTKPGSTLGTVSYMPPEQIKGMPIDPRADLFAVGACMFRLLARRRIHEARSESDLLVKMASEPAPHLRSVVPAVPQDVCAIVDRALAFDRERRYPSALTMRADVRAVRRGEQPPYASAAAAEPTAAAPNPSRSERTKATVGPDAIVANQSDPTEVGTVAPVAKRVSSAGVATAGCSSPAASVGVPATASTWQPGDGATDWRKPNRARTRASWLIVAGLLSFIALVLFRWLAGAGSEAASQEGAPLPSAPAAAQSQKELEKAEKERQKEADKRRKGRGQGHEQE